MQVKGFGDKSKARLSSYITVEGQSRRGKGPFARKPPSKASEVQPQHGQLTAERREPPPRRPHFFDEGDLDANATRLSLLELIVALAIIGVIALCAVPAFATYRRRASMTSQVVELQVIFRSLRMRAIASYNADVKFTQVAISGRTRFTKTA
jgi:hypothetical protein